MKYNCNIFFNILLYLSLQQEILSYIKLNIFTYHSNPPNKTTELEYVKYFSENNLYTYLKVGTPPQEIVATLNFNDYPFFIYYNKCEIYSNFDLEKSSTYKKRPHQYLLTDVYVYTHLVNDYYYFNDKKYFLSYLFSPMNNGTSEQKLKKLPYTCAQIGLKLSFPDLKSYNYNFIRELKLSDAIKEYVFFVEYDAEKNFEEGNLIIGIEPYEYNNKKYKYIQLKEINAVHIKRDLYWELRFNSIYFDIKGENEKENKTIYLKEIDGGLENNLNVILATYEFMEVIEKNFYNEKIKKNLCHKNYLKNNYINYDCSFLEDIQEFPTIYFVNRNLGFIFELNYKDIFIEYNRRYASLLWIDMSVRDSWKLGKPFLKKYFFSFNVDKKIIGFYNPTINDIDDNIKVYNQSNNYYIFAIGIIILLIIISGICYFFAKKIYYKERKITHGNIINELMYIRNIEKE